MNRRVDGREKCPRMPFNFMKYWYIGTTGIADSDQSNQHEHLVLANSADNALAIALEECAHDTRVNFMHVFDPVAEEILEEEYEEACADERVSVVILQIHDVFVEEGRKIMQKKSAPNYAVHRSNFNLPEPSILHRARTVPESELIHCSFEDIRILINFSLLKGMAECLGDIADHVLITK